MNMKNCLFKREAGIKGYLWKSLPVSEGFFAMLEKGFGYSRL